MPVLVAAYYLPPPAWKPNAKRAPSRWKMTRDEAAARGLTDADIVPGTAEHRGQVPVHSTGRDDPRS